MVRSKYPYGTHIQNAPRIFFQKINMMESSRMPAMKHVFYFKLSSFKDNAYCI